MAANNVLQCDWLASVFRQVLPSRILRFNKLNFLSPSPALELFLARDRVANIAEDVVPDQSVDVRPRGKACESVFSVLTHPSLKIVGDSDVELMRPAGENVGRISVFSHILIVSLTLCSICAPGHTSVEPQILRLRRRKPGAACAQDDKIKF
jgi:hypothetical protein